MKTAAERAAELNRAYMAFLETLDNLQCALDATRSESVEDLCDEISRVWNMVQTEVPGILRGVALLAARQNA